MLLFYLSFSRRICFTFRTICTTRIILMISLVIFADRNILNIYNIYTIYTYNIIRRQEYSEYIQCIYNIYIQYIYTIYIHNIFTSFKQNGLVANSQKSSAISNLVDTWYDFKNNGMFLKNQTLERIQNILKQIN